MPFGLEQLDPSDLNTGPFGQRSQCIRVGERLFHIHKVPGPHLSRPQSAGKRGHPDLCVISEDAQVQRRRPAQLAPQSGHSLAVATGVER